ncbi:hypothetical protein GCM10009679_78660 [Saccharothrix algeriensis]|uniref:Uncharacterized protein n=1 Tax=Catellatospora bangladeshensis TaxID=310355 RepID=A0A8J3JT78_9ACTN|nr:hypothetical protein Cba03nite_78160 [Catellatospora bangladeshensis]
MTRPTVPSEKNLGELIRPARHRLGNHTRLVSSDQIGPTRCAPASSVLTFRSRLFCPFRAGRENITRDAAPLANRGAASRVT